MILQIRPINLLQFSCAPVQAHVQGRLLYWTEKKLLQGGDLMYLERFTLPDAEQEEELIMERICETRDCAGFVDNPYPCRLFPARGLRELYFQNMTILYGGNGSGKSTLLNLIAEKLKLNRIAPFNSGEMVKAYVDACRYEMAFDEEGGTPSRMAAGSSPVMMFLIIC